MLPKTEILKSVEHREEIARILDQAEQAIKTWEVVVSHFYSPAVLKEVPPIFERLTECQFLAWGGYPQAERQKLAIARPEIPLDQDSIPLALLSVSGNFLFDPATHRDFLGSILGTGITREQVGDLIILGERGAQILVAPELVDFLCVSLNQVRSVPVKTTPIPLSELKISPPRTKEINTVEASLRLDALASAGFGISRSKMAEAITGGDVRVNWQEVTSASRTLESGDLISFQGKGRLVVGTIEVTKKQRYRVQLTRYL